jgi:phosphoglycerate dehydrogenase-like enzyme
MAPSRPLTIVTHPLHADAVALLRQRCEADVCERPPSPEELAARAVGANALPAFMPDCIDARLLDACPELLIVAGAFKGADNVDVEACTARGVWVTVVPDLLSAPTAELAVGLLIAVARRIREGDAAVRGGEFAGWRPGFLGTGLEGTAVAIVGMGSLGESRAVAPTSLPWRAARGCRRRQTYCPRFSSTPAAYSHLTSGPLSRRSGRPSRCEPRRVSSKRSTATVRRARSTRPEG